MASRSASGRRPRKQSSVAKATETLLHIPCAKSVHSLAPSIPSQGAPDEPQWPPPGLLASQSALRGRSGARFCDTGIAPELRASVHRERSLIFFSSPRKGSWRGFQAQKHRGLRDPAVQSRSYSLLVWTPHSEYKPIIAPFKATLKTGGR